MLFAFRADSGRARSINQFKILRDLVQKEKVIGLTPEEKCELDNYERLEHLLILARAKARTQPRHN